MKRRDVVSLQAASSAAPDAPPVVALEGRTADPSPAPPVKRGVKPTSACPFHVLGDWSDSSGFRPSHLIDSATWKSIAMRRIETVTSGVAS